jgi:2-polyprenyl-6-hydroxyphenyl methylase/3-demethylubiquinone-9 3-methyltransferase
MRLMADATDRSTHFDFGRNWAEFAGHITERSVEEAERGFARLLHRPEVEGRRVLDIGCGSGLHSLAALRLGAAQVTAVDLDPTSVETTRRTLTRFAPRPDWSAEVASVFDLKPPPHYDIVYSWGVLHHTGHMNRAIRKAAALVAPGGLFCIALYRRTPLCAAWRIEKRLYTASAPTVRRALERLYITALRAAYRLSGRDFEAYVRDYARSRGMSFETNVRDWLGGYPYESIAPEEARRLVGGLGFDPVRSFCEPPGSGVVGTGCDEYVFRRR